MKRRTFLTLLGGTAAYPLAARAQQTPLRRVVLLMANSEGDPEGRERLKAFLGAFQQRGWIDRLNVRIEIRWIGDAPDKVQETVAELVAIQPDVIVATGTPAVGMVKRVFENTPIVFVLANEPVVQGIVASKERPGGNITGFTMVDVTLLAKSVELLKFMAPAVTRVGFMYKSDSYPYYDIYVQALQATPSRPAELTRAVLNAPSDIENAVAAIAAEPGGGIVLPPDPFTAVHRNAIRAAAERHRLPYIFSVREFVQEGALMSYGPDVLDIFRRSAEYVDRILKGLRPAEMPVQAPAKFETAINVKTAKAIGLTVPPALLVSADEVVQ